MKFTVNIFQLLVSSLKGFALVKIPAKHCAHSTVGISGEYTSGNLGKRKIVRKLREAEVFYLLFGFILLP